MGYFNFGILNFCYRLWRSKKFRKFVIGFGFLAFVLSTIISNTTFAAQSDSQYTTDTTINILESYQRNVDIFVRSFNKNYGVNETQTTYFNQLFIQLSQRVDAQQNYIYLRHYSIDNENINILLYTRSGYNISNQVTTNWSPDGPNANYNMVPTTGYNITFKSNQNLNLNTLNLTASSSISLTDFIPSVLMFRMPEEIVQCMNNAGYGYSGPIVDIKQQIADMKETQEDIQADLEKTERTPEEQEEQEQEMEDMSDSVISVAETGEYNSLITSFSDYFDRLSNTLTYDETKGDLVTFRLPFVNQDIILTSNYLERYAR